jgi:hypothetical protein
MNADPMARALAKIRGRSSQRKGTHGESLARWALESFGVRQVCRIETGWRVKRAGKRIVGAVPMAKVTADWRGIWPLIGYEWRRGTSVMAEAKERSDRLVYSDLEPHQHAALAEHHSHGGLSLVVAIYEDRTVAIIQYPCAVFQPRLPGLTAVEASEAALWCRVAI